MKKTYFTGNNISYLIKRVEYLENNAVTFIVHDSKSNSMS